MLGKPALLTVILGAAALSSVSSAYAERGAYIGPHPIPAELAGSFCHIHVSHTHTYTPAADSTDYLLHDDPAQAKREFTGDPTGLGYEGPLVSYVDPHPMQFQGGSGDTDATCAIEGSHFHLHEPFDVERFEERDGTYYFVSYKAAMEARRTRQKTRRAEAIAQKKEERRLLAEAKRAEREERRESARLARASNPKPDTARKVHSSTRSKSSAKTKTPTKAKTKTPTKAKTKKPAKKAFRGWMDRRRGR